jgi:hypothetical protein
MADDSTTFIPYLTCHYSTTFIPYLTKKNDTKDSEPSELVLMETLSESLKNLHRELFLFHSST